MMLGAKNHMLLRLWSNYYEFSYNFFADKVYVNFHHPDVKERVKTHLLMIFLCS